MQVICDEDAGKFNNVTDMNNGRANLMRTQIVMAAGWLNSSEEICPPNTKVWESGWDERERGDKRSIDTLTLHLHSTPRLCPCHPQAQETASWNLWRKVGPFSAHKTASGNLCPKGWPFLATDAFGAVLKCNCYSFWPGIWTYKWVFISNV